MVMNPAGANQVSCIAVDNRVTGICTTTNGAAAMCMTTVMNMVTITPVNDTFLTIAGTLSTTNIIMANWSRMMWQSVVDRAVRMLASRPFESHFILGKGHCRRKLKTK
ncbi:hypothetical protein KIN20_005929 [Parelaphostrongylus tenuis]|uniref:Uncharacterized protein n=1 Tax=Parelaphostrongylus tenuis TaxID=148309 RepID=A0AAD5MJF4_PARTN|nr:hypothetical protein KIN20_005929 [Parelaphostrongylus tenuis]